MNLYAKSQKEALQSIDDPFLRVIKDIDYRSQCNPTSFYNLLMAYLENESVLPCTRISKIRETVDLLHDDYGAIEPYKEFHRVFRFELLHTLGLITLDEYRHDWMALWGCSDIDCI